MALGEIEHYTQARIGNVHAPETTGKFAAATFEHDTARPVAGYAAPQLHTHAVIFNVTERENGQNKNKQQNAALQRKKDWHYTQARIGNVHAPETTGKFAAATFEHDTARPVAGYAAPQLHTHAVIFNVTERENGQTRSVQSHELYASQHYGTAIYRAELATRLEKLGYELERGKDGQPEIKGYTREYRSIWRRRVRDGNRCRTISGSRESTARRPARSPPIAPATARSCCRRKRCSGSIGN